MLTHCFFRTEILTRKRGFKQPPVDTEYSLPDVPKIKEVVSTHNSMSHLTSNCSQNFCVRRLSAQLSGGAFNQCQSWKDNAPREQLWAKQADYNSRWVENTFRQINQMPAYSVTMTKILMGCSRCCIF
jgi:hypothetical protein